jgi:chromosome segregation ATPase
MKKFCMAVTFSILILIPSVFLKQISVAAESVKGNRTDNPAQEAERNRELLEIWKDHVKILTKERDAAYKEIERFKAGGAGMGGTPMAQFGGVETQAMPSPEAANQIKNLQSEVARLQLALDQQPRSGGIGSPNRELQMQFSALQTQLQQTRRELNETRSEKDQLIQEKEKALSRVDRMKGGQDEKEARDLQSQLAAMRVENKNLKSELKARTKSAEAVAGEEKQSEEAFREAREIRYENETLKARIEKLQVVEKELASTRSYFTPVLEETQAKNKELVLQARQFASQNQKLSSDLEALQVEQEEALSQIASLKSQVQMAAADKDKYRSMEEEGRRLASENNTLRQAYADLETAAKTQDMKFREMASQFSALQKNSEGIQARDAERLQQINSYKESLNANLTDIKNLKSNFESYLESLVASFDERQR